MAATYDMKINQGETFTRNLKWLQGGGNPPETGEPVKLHGYSGRCQIRAGAQNPGIIISIPVTITNADKGEFLLSLTALQTASIPAMGSIHSDFEKYVLEM